MCGSGGKSRERRGGCRCRCLAKDAPWLEADIPMNKGISRVRGATYLNNPPTLPLLILPAKLVSSVAIPSPLTLLLRLREGDMKPMLRKAFSALRMGDLIPLIGDVVTDRLDFRFRSFGRDSWRLELALAGCSVALRGVEVGVMERPRSTGSMGVIGASIGEEGGPGV